MNVQFSSNSSPGMLYPAWFLYVVIELIQLDLICRTCAEMSTSTHQEY